MRGWLIAAASMFCACSGATTTVVAPAAHGGDTSRPVGAVNSGTALERYFPLQNGFVYGYRTRSERGDEGLLTTRAVRSDATHGELRYPSGKVRRFAYEPDAVRDVASNATVLQTPIADGTSYRGEHGGQATMTVLTVPVTVPAGSFSGCMRVVEERRGDRPLRVTTTFCPDVGIVALEAAGSGSSETAELTSYAPAVELPADGVDKLPAAAP